MFNDLNVLLLFPLRDRRTGVYIEKAFKKAGCNIIALDPRGHPNKKLIQVSKEYKPDLILCSREPKLSSIIEELKNNSKMLTMWNLDARSTIQDWINFGIEPIMKSCNKFFVITDTEKYKKAGFENVEWMPQGIDSDIHKPIHLEYNCDICFIGTYGNRPWISRKSIIDKLLKQDKYSFKIFGGVNPQGDNFLNDTNANIQYNQSRVNIGCSAFSEKLYCTSVRDWKILATGKPLLTKRFNGCEKLFEGLKVFYYDNFDELMTNIPLAMNSDVKSNSKIIKEKHTYFHRIERILKDLILS